MQISKCLLGGFFCCFMGCATGMPTPSESQHDDTKPVPIFSKNGGSHTAAKVVVAEAKVQTEKSKQTQSKGSDARSQNQKFQETLTAAQATLNTLTTQNSVLQGKVNELDTWLQEEKKRNDLRAEFKAKLENAKKILAELKTGNTNIDTKMAELDKQLYPRILNIAVKNTEPVDCEDAVKKPKSVVHEVERECPDYSERLSCPKIPDDCPIIHGEDCPKLDCPECPTKEVKYKTRKCPTCFTRARLGRAGKDKLIVVSLSTKLSGQAKNIQESFIQVFAELKKKSKIPSFTLLTVQAGSRLNYPLLTHRDVQRLPVGGSNSIRSKIEDALQFGASDLRALRDLGVVDGIVTNNVGRILYITDNVRLGSDKPSNNQRGIPLAWNKDGIRLAVLTTKGCKVWKNYTGAAACTSWLRKEDLVRELKAFLR